MLVIEAKESRQRFSFICPPDRTTEARLLLNDIKGIRLVPPNPNAGPKTRIHLIAGETAGIEIKGVCKTYELLDRIVNTLADANIAGYSRATQILRYTDQILGNNGF